MGDRRDPEEKSAAGEKEREVWPKRGEGRMREG